MRNRYITILIVIFFLCIDTYAQNIGYYNRKTVIKTSLINGSQLPLNELQIERVILKRFSVSIGGRLTSLSGYLFNDPFGASYNNTNYLIYPEKSLLKEIHLSCRFYPNRLIPSPKGFYFESLVGAGVTEYSFTSKEYTLFAESKANEHLAGTYFLEIDPLRMGYQFVMKGRLTMDLNFGPEIYLVEFHPYFPYLFMSSNLYSIKTENQIVGFSGFLKIGILL